MSKNGRIEWCSSPISEPTRLSANIIRMVPGPTRMAVTHVHDIKSSFELLMPDSIQNIILDMTNLEGRRVFGKEWKELDITHVHAYFGILLLAGVYRSRGESTESLWDAETGRAIFRATMSLETFHILSRIVRFDDRETRPARRRRDKLAAIRTVWDKWVQRLPSLYNPGLNVTVDERLVGFRGRCPFRQYIPSKPARYGIKIWTACDAVSSYAWNMQMYTGKPEGGVPEKNQGARAVLDMVQGLSGHNVTCDHLFTSHSLGQELLRRKVTMIGTVRKNKTELPPHLLTVKKRPVHSSDFVFTDNTALVSYIPKKGRNVILMSTLHRDAKISGREDRKPDIILDYNATKGGVENLDKLLSCYSCQRRTLRWPLVIFYNILDVSAYNAFALWMAINPEWNQKKLQRRRIFLEELGKALVTPHMQRRQHMPRNPASVAILRKMVATPAATPARPTQPQSAVPEIAPCASKRKRCEVCGPSKDSKTQTTCSNCNKYICAIHTKKFCTSCVS
ncbi:piggyBac transposable element-derived protein 4-like [Pseudochaenichthys georgianus]|uniref:piggyBac transposable element-derived protein 4-like n=1 Tax=Pseudochaenichthys georgianus TaxID=52239 RepID=UPI00146C50FB|nr:piggyBac transposable element-derived protein 4-like [Pseudochaenichthys georgianus]